MFGVRSDCEFVISLLIKASQACRVQTSNDVARINRIDEEVDLQA